MELTKIRRGFGQDRGLSSELSSSLTLPVQTDLPPLRRVNS
jgi:hypothetical protein